MLIDLTGQTFGHWTVLGREPTIKRNHTAYWVIQCNYCGRTRIIGSDAIRRHKGERTKCACEYITKTVAMSRSQKYGCGYCTDRRTCNPADPCKYAAELEPYGCFDAYDKVARKVQQNLLAFAP